MQQVTLAVLAVVAVGTAGAQAPVVAKAGAEAVTIDLVGKSTPAAAADTTSILAGREEVARFVARARAARARQAEACGGGARDGAAPTAAPTLGGTANGWSLRLTCARPAAAPAEWRLVYTSGPSAGKGGTTRTATLGSAAAVDAWLTRLDTLVRGPRQMRLKPLPRTPAQ